MSKNTKTAIIVAASLEVHCPHCGDPLPNPWNESHLWTPTELNLYAGPGNAATRVCNACDEPFHIVAQSRVGVLES